MLLAAAAPGRVDKQFDPLLGHRLMEETVNGPVRDLRRERTLILDTAGDDEHQLGELRTQALGNPLDGACNRARIENGDPRVVAEKVGCMLRLGARREDVVLRADGAKRTV